MTQLLAGKKARDIMYREYLTIEPDTTVASAVALMNERNKGGCIVQNAIHDTVGIFTERDLLRRVVGKNLDPVRTKVGDIMTADVVFAQADDDAWELMRVMLEANFRHLPVMDGRTVVGVISLRGFCRALAGDLDTHE